MSEAERIAEEFDWWVARGLNLEPRLAAAAAICDKWNKNGDK